MIKTPDQRLRVFGIADVLGVMAAGASGRGDPEESARLFGAAEALRERLKTPLPPPSASPVKSGC